VGKIKLWVGVACFLLAVDAPALANGFYLNGLGSRASAMGGAFVGLADDFSSPFWNPAGLARIGKKTVGFYGASLIPTGTYKLDWFGRIVADAKTPAQRYFAGLASYGQPLGRRFAVGFGVYTPSALGTRWNGEDLKLITQGTSYEWMSRVRMTTFSPAFAWRPSDRIQVGIALNINRAVFDFKTYAGAIRLEIPSGSPGAAASPAEVILGQYAESLDGWGYGATVGMLFRPLDQLSVGLTLKTPSTVRFSGTAHVSNFEAMDLPADSDVTRRMTWPLWLAGGIAFTPTDRLTLTADVHFTNWKKLQSVESEYGVLAWKSLLAETGEDTRPLRWDNTIQVRFGAEYRIKSISLRGGYAWDPSPAPDETMDILTPSHDFDAYSLGLGYSLGGLQVDVSLEYLKSRRRVIPIILPRACLSGNVKACFAHSTENLENRPGYYAMRIWIPNISVSYRF